MSNFKIVTEWKLSGISKEYLNFLCRDYSYWNYETIIVGDMSIEVCESSCGEKKELVI